MRVSGEECLRISQIRPTDRVVSAAAMGSVATASVGRSAVATAYASGPTARGEGLSAAVAAVAQSPDLREQVVSSLRERIEAGAYSVSGEQIAEMMIRRLIADQVR